MSELAELMNQRHVKRMVLEQTEKIYVIQKDYRVPMELSGSPMSKKIRYLLDNGRITKIELGKEATIMDGTCSYVLKLKSEES